MCIQSRYGWRRGYRVISFQCLSYPPVVCVVHFHDVAIFVIDVHVVLWLFEQWEVCNVWWAMWHLRKTCEHCRHHCDRAFSDIFAIRPTTMGTEGCIIHIKKCGIWLCRSDIFAPKKISPEHIPLYTMRPLSTSSSIHNAVMVYAAIMMNILAAYTDDDDDNPFTKDRQLEVRAGSEDH